MPWTNRGRLRLVELMRGATLPSQFFVALCTSATAPTADTNTLSQLTEIAAGNGYTSGGFGFTPNATNFDVLTEDDANDRAIMQIVDITWTATGGPIPSSGSGARYMVLTGAGGTVGNREIWFYDDLGSSFTVSTGQALTLPNIEMQLTPSAGWTNKGARNLLGLMRGESLPTNFNMALVTAATAPVADTNTLSQLTEIAAGNGYTTGGLTVEASATGFTSATEDDATDTAYLEIKQLVYTASGGSLPASGAGASFAVLTDANGTVGSREVWCFYSLSEPRTVSTGQNITLGSPALFRVTVA